MEIWVFSSEALKVNCWIRKQKLRTQFAYLRNSIHLNFK